MLTFEHKDKVVDSFEGKWKLCNEVNAFLLIFWFFLTQSLQDKPLILHNPISLSFHDETFVN